MFTCCISGQPDLTSHFVSICNMAVELAIHGVPLYTPKHAQSFQNKIVVPTSIVLDHNAGVAQADMAFFNFLLNYIFKVSQVYIYFFKTYARWHVHGSPDSCQTRQWLKRVPPCLVSSARSSHFCHCSVYKLLI